MEVPSKLPKYCTAVILQVGSACLLLACSWQHPPNSILGQEGGLALFWSNACHSLMTMTLNYACTEAAKCTEAALFAPTY